MKKILNIAYWTITVAVVLVAAFGLAMTFIPAEYAQPVFEKIGVSYEWCVGLASSSLVVACIFIVTKLGYSAAMRNISAKANKAYECVGRADEHIDHVENLFVQCITAYNQLAKEVKQLRNTDSAILELEKQTAKDRLNSGIASCHNKQELEVALQNVTALEQETQALQSLQVVSEKVVIKEVEIPVEKQETEIAAPISGLV